VEELFDCIQEKRWELKKPVKDSLHEATGFHNLFWSPEIAPRVLKPEDRSILGKTFYLSVPAEFRPDTGQMIREELRGLIESHWGKIEDPIEDPKENTWLTAAKQKGEWDEFTSLFQNAYRRNLKKIERSDAMIVYWETGRSFAGIASDTWAAYVKGIPIYIIAPGGRRDVSSWLLGISSKVFGSKEELVQYLDGEEIQIRDRIVDTDRVLKSFEQLVKTGFLEEAVQGILKILTLQLHSSSPMEGDVLQGMIKKIEAILKILPEIEDHSIRGQILSTFIHYWEKAPSKEVRELVHPFIFQMVAQTFSDFLPKGRSVDSLPSIVGFPFGVSLKTVLDRFDRLIQESLVYAPYLDQEIVIVLNPEEIKSDLLKKKIEELKLKRPDIKIQVWIHVDLLSDREKFELALATKNLSIDGIVLGHFDGKSPETREVAFFRLLLGMSRIIDVYPGQDFSY
jgi:hypothetical protein